MSENKSFVEDGNDLIPASMLAAFAYCPRLCYLQFVQGEFLDSAEMADGRFQHRWIDAEQDAVPEDFAPFHARSVSLSAPQAGVCCKIDLLEGDGQVVTPVEYKRGEAPRAPAALYEPHLMQLAAQCLALRENGFSSVRKRGERLEVWSYEEGKVSEVRIREISKVCLYGGAEITTPAMVELMQRNVPVLHFSHGGWFLGICQGMSHKNVLLRMKQFQWAGDEERSLSIARKIIAAKIENSRIRLRRYDPDVSNQVLESLANLAKDAESASSRQSLLGIEGASAGAYFSRFSSLLKADPEIFSLRGETRGHLAIR